MSEPPADDGTNQETTRIGHVTLRVRSLSTLVPFYEQVVGLHCVERTDATAALASEPGGEPLLTLLETDCTSRPPSVAGLFHVAIRVPNRRALADAVTRVRSSGHRLSASDHLVSEALYLADPEGNGIEIYCDRPRSEWEETTDGHVEMDTRPLDVAALASEATGADAVPPATNIGHVHLEVTDVEQSGTFYRDALGFDVRATWDGALFLATDGYHHHVGLNAWNCRTEPVEDDHCGLASFELRLSDETAVTDAADRLRDRGATVTRTDGGVSVDDPDGITLVLSAE